MSVKTASRPTHWRTVVVLCRKCGKKLDGGYGKKRRESLKTILRETLREAGRRRDVRVCETGCLGLCPKDAVTALNATQPGIIHAIPAGAEGAQAMQTLLGGDSVADGGSVEHA